MPVMRGPAGFRPGFSAIRPLPPAAAQSSFLIPNVGFASQPFPRPFGLASNNAQVSGLVGANIPRRFSFPQGFGSPFAVNPFAVNPFLLNSFGTGFNPVFGQTASTLASAGLASPATIR